MKLKLQEIRSALIDFITLCAPYHSKHWRRQSQETQNLLTIAAHRCSEAGRGILFLNHESNSPTITVEPAQQSLAQIDEDIAAFDKLAADPRIAEWNAAIEKLAELSRSFSNDNMRHAPFDAKRFGLVRGTVNW